jgi:hypothetical protein
MEELQQEQKTSTVKKALIIGFFVMVGLGILLAILFPILAFISMFFAG